MNNDKTEGTILSKTGLSALLACGFFTTIGLFSPGLILPQIERAFSDTPHHILLTELVGTIAGFAFALGAPLSGSLIARLGCRRVMPSALLLFALAGVAPALLHNLWLILAARVVLGLALSAIFTGALTGIGALRADMRMQMFGWFSVVGGGAAIFLFPLVGVIGHYGWRPAFLVNLLALPVIPLVLLLPHTLGKVTPLPVGVAEAKSTDGLFSPALIGLLVLAALAGMSMLIGPIYGPLYLATLDITDTRMLAIPITIGSIAAVFASASYGKLYRILGKNGIWVATMLATGGALLCAGVSTTMPLFTTAIVVLSAMVAIMAPHVSAVALAVSPPHKASQAIGIANGVMFGAQLAFPFVAAWLRALAGLAGTFSIFGIVMLAIGGMIALRAGVARRSAAPV